MDLVACDVGNTALKIVAFTPRGAVRAWRRIPFRAGSGAGGPIPWPPGFPPPSVVVSVSDAHLAALERALRSVRLPVLGRDLPAAVANLTARPGETGIDRLCAAAAAHARARGPAVAAGAGTALTVDAVDRSGAFLGGAIGPGLRAAAAGLAAAAPRLPAPRLEPGSAAFPGRTTAGALRAGFLLGFAGALERLAAEAAAAALGSAGPRGRRPARVPVFLHGGDAPAILPHLGIPAIHAPLLVAEGARLLLLRSRGG